MPYRALLRGPSHPTTGHLALREAYWQLAGYGLPNDHKPSDYDVDEVLPAMRVLHQAQNAAEERL
jgi:hypothetical protein